MLTAIRTLFVPPLIEDSEENTRVASVLHTLLLACFCSALLLIVPAVVWSRDPISNLVVCVSAALMCFVMLYWLKLGRIQSVTIAVVLTSVGLSFIINVLASRPFPLSVCVSLISLLAAGLYLGRRAIIAVAGVNIAFVLFGALYWLLQTRYPISSQTVMLDASVLLCQVVAAGLICLLSLRELRRALNSAQTARQDLLARNHELTGLLEVSRVLNSNIRLDQQLKFIVQKLDEVAPFDWAELLALETEDHIAGSMSKASNLRPFFVGAAKTLPHPSMSLLGQHSFETYLDKISKSHDAIVIVDPGAKVIGASLLAPLISQEQVVGILVLHARRPSHFSSTVIDTVTTFASQAALAIENARLQGQAIQSAAFSATLAERSRIARDLHDSVSQALFGIVLGMRTLQAMPLDAGGRHAATYTLDLSEAALAEMRALVFENPQARLDLESIAHPRIRALLKSECLIAPGPYAIVAIPLLAETGSIAAYGWLSRILVVDTPVPLQRSRLMARDGIDCALAERMIAAQASREQRLALATDVLENDARLQDLETPVSRLHSLYRQVAGAR